MRVRQAVPGDEAALRAVRLRALRDAPTAFMSTIDRELDRTPEAWRRWMEPGVTFLLEASDDDAEPAGLVAGVQDAAEPDVAYLLAMWVDPSMRGTGAAGALVTALVAWAAALPATAVRLHVVETNVAARRLYEQHGFRPTGERIVRARDNVAEIEMQYDCARQVEGRT